MDGTYKYAGIGSRETPGDILDRMQQIAYFLSRKKFTLRSGHAKGADKAFEKGEPYGRKEIYVADDAEGRTDWFELAKKYHPAWERCNHWAKRLHARNGPIVLGDKLDDPVDFIVCWTSDGKASGGTGQALRIAKDKNIPVFNLYYKDAEQKMWEFVACLT